MRAFIRLRVHRVYLLLLSTLVLIFSLSIGTPERALAKVRPPVELGDPDDTGNQGSVPAPIDRVKLSASSLIESKNQTQRGSRGYARVSILWNLARGYLAFWIRAI